MADEVRKKILDAGLAGRRVLVTAGAAGIGLAIVERLLTHDARVFICDVDEPAIASFSNANPKAGTIKADVSSESDVDRMFTAARAELGGLDALINNAGIAGPTGGVVLLLCEVRHHRADAKPGQRTWPCEHPGQCHIARHYRRSAD